MYAALSKAGVPASFFASKARDTGLTAPISHGLMPKCCGGSNNICAAWRNRTLLPHRSARILQAAAKRHSTTSSRTGRRTGPGLSGR